MEIKPPATHLPVSELVTIASLRNGPKCIATAAFYHINSAAAPLAHAVRRLGQQQSSSAAIPISDAEAPPIGNLEQAVYAAIRDSIMENFGDVGAAAIGTAFSVKYCSPFTRIGIVRSSREDMKMVWASVTFVSSINTALGPHPCTLRVVHVSGTIKSAQLHAIKFDRKLLTYVQRRMGLSDEDVAIILRKTEEGILSVDV
ncbi:Rpp14/Pop5 family-domain-containing protein [Zopfochytrium polystomum]|nr:Rpp14/Pop5 family-domain-containing protein [Zopfochytrium polystomum]